MRQCTSLFVIVFAATGSSIAATAHASVMVESSRRTTWALAGTTDDGGGIDTDTSTALGPLVLTSSMGPTDFFVESSVSLVSSSTASGISGTINLAQRGLDDSYNGMMDRYLAWVWVDHVMTFVLDMPTPYRMEVSTLSSTWGVPPIYGLAIAPGAWNSPDDGGISFVDAVAQPVSGTSVGAGVLAPGRYTAFYRFTSASFGPNTFDLSTASLAYSLTIPAPGAGVMLALAGTIAAGRRRSHDEANRCQTRERRVYIPGRHGRCAADLRR